MARTDIAFDEERADQDPSSSTHKFDWRGILYALLDKWWVIVLCVAAAWGMAGMYLMRSKPIYASTAVIKFEADPPKILGTPDMLGEEMRSDEQRKEKLKEIQLVLQSSPLLGRVVDSNHLAADSSFVSTMGTNSPDQAKLVSALRRSVRVTPRAGTTFIDVTVEQPNPTLAAQLANSLVDELIQLNSESYHAASQSTSSLLAEEAQNLQRKLADSETNLRVYKDQTLTLEQRQTIVADNLKELNQKLNEAKAERIRLESEYSPVGGLGTNAQDLLVLPRVASDPAVSSIRSSIAQQEVEFANLQKVYLPKHPIYIQAESKLVELRQSLANAALKVGQTMRVAYENGVNREKALATELENQEKLAQLLNRQSIPHNTLMRDMDQYRALYDSVVKRMGEATIAGNLENRSVQVFHRAAVPKSPVRPQRLLIVFASLASGLGLGVLLILGSEMFDDSFKTLNETEGILKLPVLSTVPHLPAARANGKRIVMEDDSPFSGAESFRALRTSLFLLDPNGRHRSFLMTSTLAGEGKTFCTVNYAVSLALQGLRTLVIDCDVRRPVLEEVLYGERKDLPGLADYLRGGQLNYQRTRIENLYFVPAGTAAANASELLAWSGLKGLLNETLDQFDRVVVDSAPIFGVSDTLRLVKDVDAVCLVVLAGKTPRKLAARCLQLLSRAGAPVDGIILNAVRDSLRSAYDNPFYDYGYYATTPRKRGPRVPRTSPTPVIVSESAARA